MGFADIVLMAIIISGALYLLYRSLWKKKGYCSGCDSGSCGMKGKGDQRAADIKSAWNKRIQKVENGNIRNGDYFSYAAFR